MNIIELVTNIKREAGNAGVGIPKYIDVEDISDSRVCINGNWTTEISAQVICWKDGEWVYFETDNERGYIAGIQNYKTEEEVCENTYEYLSNFIKAEQEGNSDKDFAIRYAQKEYGYSQKKAEDAVEEIMEQEDVFGEFYNYLLEDEYCNEDGEIVKVAEYSAKHLVDKEGFTPVAAYRFLVKLRKNREEAEKALRNGKVSKE